MKFNYFLLLFFCLTGLSCTSFKNAITPKMLTLTEFNQIALGAKKTEVESDFGKPQGREGLSSSNSTVWTYTDVNQSLGRASLVFDETSGQLTAKTWHVLDGDPEQNIDIALKSYPDASFKKRDAAWVNPHVSPDIAYYEDYKKGLSIEVIKRRNEVSLISWMPINPAPAKYTW